MTSTPTPGPKRGALIRLAGLILSLLGITFVLRHIDSRALRLVLAQANPGWLAAAWIVFGVGFLAAALRWHLVLVLGQCRRRVGTTFRTVLIGHFFNTILFGPTGGDIAKATLYARRNGFPVSAVLATCLLDRFLGGAGFLILTLTASGLSTTHARWSAHLQKALESRPIMIGSGAVLGVLGLLALYRWRHHLPASLHHAWDSLRQTAKKLFSRPRVGVAGVGLSLVSHICISSVFIFSLLAVTRSPFSVLGLFWVFPLISLITSAPITFSGAGLREGAALFFLGRYGIPEEDAVAAALLVLAVYVLWALIGGAVLWSSRSGAQPVAEQPSGEALPLGELEPDGEPG